MRGADIKAMVTAKAEVKILLELLAVAQYRRLKRFAGRDRAGNLHFAARRMALLKRAFVGWATEMALGAIGTSFSVDAVIR